tara:strand:+ start:496 stop:618 length:123 start_codon:yes stop_codon:yes gene_type:complete
MERLADCIESWVMSHEMTSFNFHKVSADINMYFWYEILRV